MPLPWKIGVTAAVLVGAAILLALPWLFGKKSRSRLGVTSGIAGVLLYLLFFVVCIWGGMSDKKDAPLAVGLLLLASALCAMGTVLCVIGRQRPMKEQRDER